MNLTKQKIQLIKELSEDIVNNTNITFDSIVQIVTNEINTPYIKRKSETFNAILLPTREFSVFSNATDIRIIRLDKNKPEILYMSKKHIKSINGKGTTSKTKWEVQGNSGSYIVNMISSDNFTCTCPGFKFRKKCKHIENIKKEISNM